MSNACLDFFQLNTKDKTHERLLPKTPSLKLMVTTMMFPVEEILPPSHMLPVDVGVVGVDVVGVVGVVVGLNVVDVVDVVGVVGVGVGVDVEVSVGAVVVFCCCYCCC